jgi:hypothetical protein
LANVYNPDSAGKDRTRLTKTIVIALRELMRQPEPNDLTRDLAAYVVLALSEISNNIDVSVEAWEKRGYWVKADRFRLDWEWSGKLSTELKKALLAEDWGNVALCAVKIASKFSKVTIAEHHRLGTPWVGAYQLLNSKRTAS